MIGLVITGIIAVSAVIVIPNLSYVNLLYVDQQQLRNLALDTLKTMLLDAGYPADWGSAYDFDPDQIERFGLALAGSSSLYVLDPDKVQRLVVGNPAGFIEYEDIRERLKLEGYGFNFQIIPPFKVVVNDEDFDGESNPVTLSELTEGVEVFVSYNSGSPIPKASVEATVVYVLADDKENFYTVKASNSTNVLGRCLIKPDIPPNHQDDISDFIIVFKVGVADVTTVTSSYMEGFHQHVVDASIIGNNITLYIPREHMPGGNNTSGKRWVENIISVGEGGVWNMYDGNKIDDPIIYGSGSDKYIWSRLFPGLNYDAPLFLIFDLSVPIGQGEGGRQLVLFLGPRPNWTGSRVQAYGDPAGTGGASSAVKIQRNVVISGMTYIAELTLWKESP